MAPTDPEPGAGIRTATPGDRPQLLALQELLDRQSPDLLDGALSGAGIVLVSTAGRPPTERGDPADVVGYLLAVPGSESTHVAEIAVDPAHRREGRATALIDALAARTDATRLTVAVAPDNEAAIRCYRSAGFENHRRDPAFFDGDPGIVLAREK